jgi:indole-3-glycerol phosphate synthase
MGVMMILDKIVTKRKEQLTREKSLITLEEIKDFIRSNSDTGKDFSLEGILKSRALSLIAEVKKASPSKGVINAQINPVETALKYQAGGAGAISVLTEEEFFMGDNSYLKDIARKVNIPILRKDFIIDPYQIYHSKYLGASIILLIVAILDRDKLKEYLSIADSLGLDAIVEVHTEEELLVAIEIGARIIGINNRNLNTFEVDLKTTKRLMELMPEDKLVISESGIKTADDVQYLKGLGVKGILIGETLMRSTDVGKAIEELGL